MNLSFDEMYDAIGKKESLYEGLFITAVKTTGIFCRPSCRARKPLAVNVEFFKNSGEALKDGYRPCKVCRPIGKENEVPEYISDLVKELHQDPLQKIKDWDLRQKGLEPTKVRRWFKKHHNMTFQAYQRLIRINTGYRQIQKGMTVTNTAFEIGYESLSGFNDGFKSVFGQSPKNNETKEVIYLDRFTTKLGSMFIAATNKGICLLEFTDRKMLEAEFKDLQKRRNAVIVPGSNEHIEDAKLQLEEYFEGKRKIFELSIDPVGTEFQKSVWNELIKIPYGQTCSYQQQANHIGNPNAVRAVANANGMNKIGIVIPCHRVIGSNGKLTGYGGGLPRKQWLLDLEKSK